MVRTWLYRVGPWLVVFRMSAGRVKLSSTIRVQGVWMEITAGDGTGLTAAVSGNGHGRGCVRIVTSGNVCVRGVTGRRKNRS